MNREKHQKKFSLVGGSGNNSNFSREGTQMEISPTECLSSWHQALAWASAVPEFE